MENGIFLNDVPIDLFIKYFDSATLQDEEFNTPVYETDTNVLKVDANGNQLYRDSAGFLTTQSSYSNKFLNHQKAIRKSFAKISEDMTWMSSANKHTVVIVEKNKAENLEYYEEIETNYAYEGRVTVPDGSVIDDNRKISFETLTGGKKKETTKLPIIIQDINKLPVYTVYTSSLQNTLNTGTIFYAPEIQARYDTLKSPETNTDAHNALLNLKRRYILFDTDKAILNVQGEIKAGISRVYAKDASDSIKDSISVNLENYLVNYNSKTAQILIPWKITNSNIKNYLNRKIKIGFGTNAGMKVYEFIIKGDATSISTVKLEFVNNDGKGNFTTELISAEEIFSADQISYNTPDYYIQVIFNVTIDEDGIEHPPVVTEDAKSTIICNVQRARLADVNNQLTSGGDDNIIAGSSLSERDAPRTEYEYVKEKRYEAKTAIGKGILGFFRALFNLDEYKMVLRPKTVYNEYSADYYNITGPFKFDENIKGFTTITTTNYFRNPYYNEGSNDEYIKETITKQLEVQDDKLNLPVLQKDLPLDLKDFKNKFQLFEDSLAPVRGTYISDEVFFDKRKLRLHSMLLSFIENEEEEFNLDGEMNNSDGLVGIYNYCKGFDTDLKEASKNPILKEESNMASTLYDFDKLNYRIILENKPYTAPLSTETNSTEDVQLYRSDGRGVLQRITEYEKYPTNLMHEKLSNQTYEVDMSNITYERNVNKPITSIESNQRNICKNSSNDTTKFLINSAVTAFSEILTSPKFLTIISNLHDENNPVYGKKLEALTDSNDTTEDVDTSSETEKTVISKYDFDLKSIIEKLMTVDSTDNSRWEVL